MNYDSGLSPLYLISDRKLAVPDLPRALEAALRGGARLIQLREKDLAPAELKTLAESVLKLTRRYGAKLLLNGNPALAAEIGADGVQLGIRSPDIAEARRILGARALIGYSAHSARELQLVADQGADFATFSPVYYTASKAQYGPPQGLQALQETCRNAPLPVYALGGIDATRVGEVLAAGACGVALISAVLASPDPARAVRELLTAVEANCARLRDPD